MAGLLDLFTGDNADAMMAVGGGLLSRSPAAGFARAQNLLAEAPYRRLQMEQQRMQMEQAQMQMEQMRRQQAEEQQLQTAARGAYRTPEQANAMSMGPMPDGSNVPMVSPGFDKDRYLQSLYGINPMKAVAFEKSIAKDNSPLTVAPGASLVDRKTMRPLFTAPTEPKEKSLPAAIQEYQFAQQQGYAGTFEQWDTGRKKAGASRVEVNTNDPTALAKAGMHLQNDVRGALKDHFTISDQYKAMQKAAQDPSAQGDTALLYSFFKVLDPVSTVREGEIDMVKSSRSIPDRFKGYAQKLANGQFLMPHERQDILTQAERQVQSRMPRASQDVKAYRENAKRLQLDPNLYVPDPYDGLTFKPQGGGGNPANPVAAAAAAELARRGGK